MRMSFTVGDEQGYRSTRDELRAGFTAWAARRGDDLDPEDVGLLLDWKWGDGDGDLSGWTIADVDEFLFDWCPRELITTPQLAAGIPGAVAAFVEFLADRDLLAPRGPGPAAIRENCTASTAAFVQEMGGSRMVDADGPPADLAAALTGLLDADADGLAALSRLTGTTPDDLAEMLETAEDEPRLIGPVRLPGRAELLESAGAAPFLRRIRALAERCAKPGLALTAKGNLRVADARRLVHELETGDVLDEEHRRLASVEQLPELSRLVDIALAAGAVRRRQDRMVAVAAFAALDDAEAHARVVHAAVEEGLAAGPDHRLLATFAPVDALVHSGTGFMLAELLDAHAAGEPGLPAPVVHELFATVATLTFPGLAEVVREWLHEQVDELLERLVDFGVTTAADDAGVVALTPAGIAVAVRSTDELPGLEVVRRPDPGTASVEAMLEVLPLLDRDAAVADLAAWSAGRGDAATAAAELVTAIAAPDRDPGEVLIGLDVAGAVLGAEAEAAAAPHLEGPHDPMLVCWLVTRGALDQATLDPQRVLTGVVAMAAASLELGGPDLAVQMLGQMDRAEVLELLERIWRVDDAGVPVVLEAIGAHHPDRKVAKLARKSLMKWRNRAAQG